MKSIGDDILRLREIHNLTQSELAEYLGVSRQTISSWESGRTVPGGTILRTIKDTFDVDLLDNQIVKPNLDSHKETMRCQRTNSKGWLLLLTVLLCIGHMVGAFVRMIPFFYVFICPLSFMIVHLIMHIGFGYCIRNNDFTMIAGYKRETDSNMMTVAFLNTFELFTGIMVVVCELLFCSIYFIDSKETKTTFCWVLVGVFALFVVIIDFVSKYKYSRQYHGSETNHPREKK